MDEPRPNENSSEAWHPGKGSTGPRTEAGKARSARNALKHGLCAKKYVFIDEDADAFQEYRIEMIHELRPVGSNETALADRAAQLLFRLGRVMPIESDMIDHERETATGDLCSVGQVFARPSFGGLRSVALITRYEGGLQRSYCATMREFRAAQAERRKAEAAEAESGWSEPWRVLPARLREPAPPPPEPGFGSGLEQAGAFEADAPEIQEIVANTGNEVAAERPAPVRRAPFHPPIPEPDRPGPINNGEMTKRTPLSGANGSPPGELSVRS